MNGKPWERQQNESDKAFTAFRLYLDLGDARSLRTVNRQLSKSLTIISRWSSRWGWPDRVAAYRKHLNEIADQAREKETAKQARKILSPNDVLIGLSTIAEIDIAEVFEPDGSFNLAEAQKRGTSKLIKSISFDKDTGRVTKIECYSAHEGYRDMAKHHQLMPTAIKFVPVDEADKLIDDAVKKHGLPKPETFGGQPVVESEM